MLQMLILSFSKKEKIYNEMLKEADLNNHETIILLCPSDTGKTATWHNLAATDTHISKMKRRYVKQTLLL